MGTPVVGVTGSIGTGKSTFAQLLTENGGTYIDADQLAKNLMKPDREAYDAVVEEFGPEILDEEGQIDNEALADRVFQDPDNLDKLEAIVHPLVIESISEQIRNTESTYYVVEAALLFESDMDELCNWVVVVTAPRESVHERLKDRGISVDEIKRRRSRQLSQDEKVKRADQVVKNDGTVEELRRSSEEVLQRIRELSLEDGH